MGPINFFPPYCSQWGPTVWLPKLFKISFVFSRRKKFIQVWKNSTVSKWWQWTIPLNWDSFISSLVCGYGHPTSLSFCCEWVIPSRGIKLPLIFWNKRMTHYENYIMKRQWMFSVHCVCNLNIAKKNIGNSCSSIKNKVYIHQ